jgi:hypothetical protein
MLRSCFWHEVVTCWGFKTFDGCNSQFCTTYLLLGAPKSATKRMSVASSNITGMEASMSHRYGSGLSLPTIFLVAMPYFITYALFSLAFLFSWKLREKCMSKF